MGKHLLLITSSARTYYQDMAGHRTNLMRHDRKVPERKSGVLTLKKWMKFLTLSLVSSNPDILNCIIVFCLEIRVV